MSAKVEAVAVTADEADLRLDRWFRRHYPGLGHGRLEKLLRTGQIRVDGRRAKAGLRLAAGQTVRVPPQAVAEAGPPPRPPGTGGRDAAFIRALVIHRDDDVIALNKPAGLAVQGGSRTARHIDGMLDALTFGAAERPRLVHRLDRDTSGVLLLARTARAAARLGKAFRDRTVRKIYWALVIGVPAIERGRIDLPLGKKPGPRGERVAADAREGKRAVTLYRVIERVGDQAAWIALWPLTGRTHQLRAHCAAIGTPIAGDRKYGRADAFLPADGIARQPHLHARSLVLPHPAGCGELCVTADLPPHMADAWRHFGFAVATHGDPFPETG